jgi:hypothetical protein
MHIPTRAHSEHPMPLQYLLETITIKQEMDISTIRLRNLRTLMDGYETLAAFAEAVDTNPAYLSQCRSDNLKANVGGKLARKIERSLGLPKGWMDVDQTTRGRSPTFTDIKVLFTFRASTIPWNNCPHHSKEDIERMNHAFCVQVKGDGFGAAIRSGCGLILDPKAAVKALEWVYVERLDDTATVTQVLQMLDDELICLPINGGSQFSIDRREIRLVLVVVAILPPAQLAPEPA